MMTDTGKLQADSKHKRKRGIQVCAVLVFVVVMAITLAKGTVVANIPERCDSQELIASLKKVVSTSPTVPEGTELLYVKGAEKLEKSETLLRCKGMFALNIGDEHERTYRVTKENDEIYVFIDAVEGW